MTKWFIYILMLVFFASCISLLRDTSTSQANVIQPVVEHYANGQLKSKGQYLNGNIHGEWVYWNGDGDTVSIMNYNYGVLDGFFKIWKLEKEYDDNSEYTSDYAVDYGDVVQKVGYYENGILTGRYVVYYNSSSIKVSGNYNKGRMDGEWKEFSKEGDTLSVINYSLGDRKGPFMIWNFLSSDISTSNLKSKEKIKHQGIYKFNKLDGNYVEFYSDEKIKCSGGYLEGKREGDWTWYDSNGIIEKVAAYKFGDLISSEKFNEK